MTTNAATPIARIHDVPDLLGIIPHLVGFHPEESLVALVMVANRIELTARVDLADVAEVGHAELFLERLLVRWPTASIWLIGYGANEAAGWTVLERAVDHLGGALAGEPVWVRGGRFRLGGPHLPARRHDPTSTPAAATATFSGLQARASRAELRHLVRVDPAKGEVAEAAWLVALDRLLGVPEQQLPSEMARAVTCPSPDALLVDELVWLALLTMIPESRDQALIAITRDNAERMVELWSRVVRNSPEGSQQHALGLLGMAAWVSGDGGLQNVCLEELDELGADIPLQGLLDMINEAMVPPDYWDELRPQLVDGLAPPATDRGR